MTADLPHGQCTDLDPQRPSTPRVQTAGSVGLSRPRTFPISNTFFLKKKRELHSQLLTIIGFLSTSAKIHLNDHVFAAIVEPKCKRTGRNQHYSHRCNDAQKFKVQSVAPCRLLCWLLFLGFFLVDPTSIPPESPMACKVMASGWRKLVIDDTQVDGH